ncbi:putative methyltransferase-like protein 24 [Ciona intestinalis]
MYSFGVGNDWSFDDEIAKRGCEVHAFDPSMDRTDNSPLGDHGVRFHKIGISGTDIDKDANGWKMRTFSSLLKELGHNGRWMDYLKVDTDAPGGGGFEDMIMQELLDTGLYSCVRQYSMEIHLMGPLTQKRWLDRSRNIYNQMTQLNDHGWRLYNKTDNVRAAKIILKRPDFSQDEMRPRVLNGAEEILWETSFVNFDVKGPCLVK